MNSQNIKIQHRRLFDAMNAFKNELTISEEINTYHKFIPALTESNNDTKRTAYNRCYKVLYLQAKAIYNLNKRFESFFSYIKNPDSFDWTQKSDTISTYNQLADIFKKIRNCWDFANTTEDVFIEYKERLDKNLSGQTAYIRLSKKIGKYTNILNEQLCNILSLLNISEEDVLDALGLAYSFGNKINRNSLFHLYDVTEEEKPRYQRRLKDSDTLCRRSQFLMNFSALPSFIKKPVNADIYAPKTVCPGDFMMVQITLTTNKKNAREFAIEAKYRDTNNSTAKRGSIHLSKELQKGDDIYAVLTLHCNNTKIYYSPKKIKWEGNSTSISFLAEIPSNITGNNLGGIIDLKINNDLDLSHEFTFITGIEKNADLSATKIHTNYYSPKVFISYCQKDDEIVTKHIGTLDLKNADVFKDTISLKSGDRYKSIIKNFLKNTDRFILYWSKNAANSTPVKQEIKTILKIAKEREEQNFNPPKITPYKIGEINVFPKQLQQLNFEPVSKNLNPLI